MAILMHKEKSILESLETKGIDWVKQLAAMLPLRAGAIKLSQLTKGICVKSALTTSRRQPVQDVVDPSVDVSRTCNIWTPRRRGSKQGFMFVY